MHISEFVRIIEKVLPPVTAMDGDRIGVQVFTGNGEVHSVLTCLEITDSVIDEALLNACNCIVTFHPLLFSPLKIVTTTNRIGRCVTRAIKHDISIIAIHTNYDAYPQGTNFLLAEKLGVVPERALVADEIVAGYGMGLVCSCKQPMSATELVQKVREVCGSPVRYSEGPNSRITHVAIVGGSGTSFLRDAVASGAQAFITSDVKYHTFHEASESICLIDPGHFEMEQFVPEGLAKLLQEESKDFENAPVFRFTGCITNPVRYTI